MSAPPPISVLLPVRDGARHLPEAIASLEGQTEGDFEVVAVDDGSVDATPALLRDWAARDARVRVIRQDRSGLVPALERGRAAAGGAYLARMDADDVAEPERLALQRALLDAEPGVAGCGTWVRYFPGGSVRDGARRYERWVNASAHPAEVAREIFVECPLPHPTFFLRAAAVKAVGGYRDPGWPEDYDLVLRLWGAGAALAKVPRVLLRWREGPHRLSRTDDRYGHEAFRRCKAHHLRRTLLRDGRAVVIWGAGPVGKALSRALAREGVRIAAFAEVDSRKIGQRIHDAPVVDTEGGLAHRAVLHVAAVGQPGGRGTLRALLAGAGLEELRDFVAAA